LADDPDEELFAGVAVEEAAIGGFCALEADALMSTWAMGVGGGVVAGSASAGEVAVADEEWRGVPGESQIRRGAVCLLLRVGGGATRVQKKRSFALGENGSAPGKRATEEAVRALSLDCSEKSRDRCSSVNFNRRVCEIGKRLAWKCTEPAAEMLYRSSR
jgi:hypothetical protein